MLLGLLIFFIDKIGFAWFGKNGISRYIYLYSVYSIKRKFPISMSELQAVAVFIFRLNTHYEHQSIDKFQHKVKILSPLNVRFE